MIRPDMTSIIHLKIGTQALLSIFSCNSRMPAACSGPLAFPCAVLVFWHARPCWGSLQP